jgi:hypothetical protein
MLTLFLLLLGTVSGAIVTYFFVPRWYLPVRLAIGVCLANAVPGLLTLAVADKRGVSMSSVAFFGLLSALPLLFLFRENLRQHVGREWSEWVRLERASREKDAFLWFFRNFWLGVLLYYLAWFFYGACFINKGEVQTLNHANLGDLPYHLGIIQGFIRGENFPPEHPEFAGARLTYPFLTDYVAAIYATAGVSIPFAMFLQNFSLIIATLVLLGYFTRLVTKSRTAALFAIPLLLFSGGWGFFLLRGDINGDIRNLWPILQALPHDYTEHEQLYRWGNAMTVLLGTQRSIVLGIPMALAILSLWWKSQKEAEIESGHHLLFAGILTGLLPLCHIHTLLTVLMVGGVQALLNLKQWRQWLVFFITALLLAAPSLFFMLSNSATDTGNFRKVFFGWDSNAKNIGEWALFWIRNLGLFLPLLVLTLTFSSVRRTTKNALISSRLFMFYIPFLLAFIVPNVVQLAPWVWDNIKVLIYFYIASIPLVAALLARLWRENKFVAGLSLFLMCFSGMLDVSRVLSGNMTQTIFNADEMKYAEEIAAKTPARSRILGGFTFNHPIYWSGRRSITGYAGHLWSHGLNPAEREADMRRVYAGEADADALLKKWEIDFVSIGTKDRENNMVINEEYWKKYTVVVEVGPYKLYKVR